MSKSKTPKKAKRSQLPAGEPSAASRLLAVFGKELRAEERHLEKMVEKVHPGFRNRLKEHAAFVSTIAEVVSRTLKKTANDVALPQHPAQSE